MMRALELHLANWMQQQVCSLGNETGLFGQVVTVAGELDHVFQPPLAPGAIAILVQVQSLQPLPDGGSLSSPTTDDPATFAMQAAVGLRLLGDAGPLGAAPGRTFDPAGSNPHQVDLAALAILALLRERVAAAPDGAPLPQPALSGTALVAQGGQQLSLAWTRVAAQEPTAIVNAAGQRQWQIPLVVDCAFRLSPGGAGARILTIGSTVQVHGR